MGVATLRVGLSGVGGQRLARPAPEAPGCGRRLARPAPEAPGRGRRAAAPAAPRWLLPLTTGLAVLALGWLAAEFRPENSSVAVWWPAAGVSVAAYIVAWRRAQRVGVLAAVVLGVFCAELLADYSPAVSLGFAVANLANPLITVALLSRWTTDLRLKDAQDYVRFCAAASIGALVTAVLGASTVHFLHDGDAWAALVAVLPSHLSAVLCITPGTLLASRSPAPAGRVETAVQVVGTLAMTAVLFSPGQELPLGFICIGFLIWGAARVSPTCLHLQVVLAAVVAAVATSLGWGPYAAVVSSYGLPPESAATLLDVVLIGVPLSVYPLALARDAHRAALAEAQESREVLDSVLAGATGTAIIGADLDGVVTTWNAGAERIFGWTAQEVCGRRSLALLFTGQLPAGTVARELDPRLARLVAPLVGGSAWVDEDWGCVTRGGGRVTVAFRMTARRSADGAVTGWIVVGRDVTEKRRTEGALRDALERERQAVQRLEELDAVKTSFVQLVSHELRTPMTSVLGYTDMLLGEHVGPLNPQQQKMLSSVSRNGRRLLKLIEDLLTLSRIEQGAFSAVAERLDLRTSVQRGCEAVAPQAEAASVRLEVDLGPAHAPVLGDPDQLERVVVNLLANAVKFSPGDEVVRVGLESEAGWAVLTVVDHGMGIPEAEIGRLFQRFFRSSTAQRAEVQGSGLGLAIVKEVVDRHDGRVEVESREGEGTTVRVRLPLRATASSPRVGMAAVPA